MSQPLLSLAVIVRDQAGQLDVLLRNHRRLYDEAVVVDTGSRDGSAEVAAAQGARVISSQWRQDFSAARNDALDLCSGRWILVLDCDEAIGPEDQARLRKWLQEAPPCLGIMDQRNYTYRTGLLGFVPVAGCEAHMSQGAPGFILRRQIRVFPGGRDLRYSGRVHETLERSPAARLMARSCLGIALHHYGHLEGTRGHLRRVRRNGELLRREIREHPLDPVLLTEFAEQLVAEGRLDFARRVCLRALEVAPGHSELHQSRLMLARLNWREDPDAALRQAERALADRPDLPECWREAVRANHFLGLTGRARRVCQRGLVVFPRDPVLEQLYTQVSGTGADIKCAENG